MSYDNRRNLGVLGSQEHIYIAIQLYGLDCRWKNRCLIEHSRELYEGFYIQFIMGVSLADLLDPRTTIIDLKIANTADLLPLMKVALM